MSPIGEVDSLSLGFLLFLLGPVDCERKRLLVILGVAKLPLGVVSDCHSCGGFWSGLRRRRSRKPIFSVRSCNIGTSQSYRQRENAPLTLCTLAFQIMRSAKAELVLIARCSHSLARTLRSSTTLPSRCTPSVPSLAKPWPWDVSVAGHQPSKVLVRTTFRTRSARVGG